MRFEILPAIDVSDGRLAVYTQRGPRPVEAFDGDPATAAAAFAEAGARWLHVVDMDLAFGGESQLDRVLQTVVAAAPGVGLQASGGIRTEAQVDRALDAGASRVVLGSTALADEAGVEALVSRHREALVIGVEVDGGRIRSRGADPVERDLPSTVAWLTAVGAPMLLVTAVDRVGELAGPDLDTIGEIVRSGVPVVAAGGVSSIGDLEAIRETGAAGAVVGRAAQDGGLDLAQALRALAV